LKKGFPQTIIGANKRRTTACCGCESGMGCTKLPKGRMGGLWRVSLTNQVKGKTEKDEEKGGLYGLAEKTKLQEKKETHCL